MWRRVDGGGVDGGMDGRGCMWKIVNEGWDESIRVWIRVTRCGRM